MQRRTLSVLATIAAALPLATQAGTMDYSFVELAYLDTELDAPDVDGDGFALRGSIPFLENFFAFAEYEDLGFDLGVDVTTFQVGAGGHWPLNEKVDLVGRFGIVKRDLEARRFGFDEDEDGFTLGARVRSEVMPRLELEGGFDYLDVDSGDDTSIVLEGRYFFIENVSGGLRLDFGDEDTIGIAARLTF
ncbi:MAG: outer membrane beta-barrel protein [Steroidobacter sp.]